MDKSRTSVADWEGRGGIMRKTLTVLVLSVLIGCVAAGGTASESIVTHDEYVEVVASLTDLLERATYLAITGFSAYDAADQLVAAQELVNLFEGLGGPNYESQTDDVATEDELGILARFESWRNADISDWVEENPYSQFFVFRDVSWNTEHFLRLSYVSALEALRIAYSLIGPKDAFRASYAFLLAARGGFDDPFLVAGVKSLQNLLSVPEDRALQDDSIQATIDVLPDGGTLQLESGVYREPLIITKSVTILGATQSDRESGLDGGTVLEGVAWESVISVVSDEPVTVVIEDLTIRDGRTAISLWLTLDQPNVTLTLKNVTFLENGTGLVLGKGTVATCTDCRFEANELAVRALAPEEGAQASFTKCVFEGNGSAIGTYGNQTITLDACLIQNGTDPDGDIRLAGEASLEMRDSELHRVVGRGIVLMDTASMTLVNSVIETTDSHAIAVASGGTGLGNPVSRNCGVSMGVNETELPLGTIAGRGNTIIGGVCPESLQFLTQPAPAEISVVPGQSIQAAIESVADGGVITLEPGMYHENLDISRSLTLIGEGGVTLTPDNREIPAIRISESIDVVIQDIRVEDAETGIETSQASCRISGCLFRTTNVAIQTMLFGSDTVRIEDCTFTGEETAGQGILALGDGRIEIEDCEFLELTTGAILAGMVSARITTSTLDECASSILISSTVNATLTGNHISNSYVWGIRIAAVSFDAPAGSLVMVDNVIENRSYLAISLCGVDDPNELTLTGYLEGSGNVIERGPASLCPVDYDWPEGFFADE
jgi:Right handed beta helix region